VNRTLLLGGVLYAVVVVLLRWNHPGDVVHEIALAERLLRGEPLYATVVPDQGSLWPPFASLALVPFALIARLNYHAATAAWSVLGVVALVVSVRLALRWGTRAVWLTLAATALAIQTNFEHRNVNTVLLALVMAGIVDLDDRRDARAGVWFGLAAALKAFPAVLLLYLALRRSWRACGAALAAATVATLLPLVPYGPAGALRAIADWLAVGTDPAQWQLATSDQSLRALIVRLGGAAPPGAAVAASLLPIVALAGVTLARPSMSHLAGVGFASLAAVLAAPIAWVHYYVLAFPAWLALLSAQPRTTPRIAALWAAGGSTWLTIGRGPVRRALLGAGAYTWGGLLLLGLLATMQPRPPEIE
jgi:alpha-1,2-mannosyltransferase